MRRTVHWSSGLLLSAFTTIVVVIARPSVHARQQSDQSAPQAAREARRTVSDGVYTSEQAMRGQTVVEAHCVECHGERLQGIEGPELVGRAFMATWNSLTLEALFRKTADMPKDRVDTVTDRERVAAIAYLLQANGFPPGTSELALDRTLMASIAIGSAAGGRSPGALVKVNGCLTSAPDDQWLLTGPERLRLISVFPRPTAHVGKMVVVTGLFIRTPAGDGLNVISIEGTGRPCD